MKSSLLTILELEDVGKAGFNPDQPRDWHGRFGEGPGAAMAATAAATQAGKEANQPGNDAWNIRRQMKGELTPGQAAAEEDPSTKAHVRELHAKAAAIHREALRLHTYEKNAAHMLYHKNAMNAHEGMAGYAAKTVAGLTVGYPSLRQEQNYVKTQTPELLQRHLWMHGLPSKYTGMGGKKDYLGRHLYPWETEYPYTGRVTMNPKDLGEPTMSIEEYNKAPEDRKSNKDKPQ